ncbi:MAG: DUF5916 domain-containing protein [Vicinamibacterales bacterium]
MTPPSRAWRWLGPLPFVLLLSSSSADAAPQKAGPAAATLDDADPPVPVAPHSISRGENGHVVVRAIPLSQPLRVDGRLDDAVYADNEPVGGFIQATPANGQPASERTEAWVMFDERFLYITGKCYDSAPPEQWTANELRRDTNQLRQNDMFGVLIDTFHDGRNGYNFYANPLGGFTDQAVTDEGNPNPDWNPVWQVRAGRFDGGWVVEMAIPFKSIRYHAGHNQTWGLQLRRAIRRKNEWTHLTALPAANAGSSSIFRVSRAATLVGLDLPAVSRNMELKPYGISKLTTDHVRTPSLSNVPEGTGGLDAKYGVTANLTADITVNTDFAQVEVDEQQVNLTRFSLQFPEKRDFFLEGRGIFDFGRAGAGSGGSAALGNSSPANGSPTLFYSRRIGLNGGRVIPIEVGGRLTGKVGALNLQAGDEAISGTPSTNFTAVRIKRDVLRRSSIGVLATNRSASAVVPGASNQALGIDGAFSFFQDLYAGGYYARSRTEGRNRDNDSYQARVDYNADRYGVKVDYLKVGDNFNPEVGFTRRDNFRRSFASARFSPRPTGRSRVRKWAVEGTLEYLVNGASQVETRQRGARGAIEFQNSDMFTLEATSSYELLVRPFTVSPGVVLPVGGYGFSDVTASYAFGQQRRISGTASLQAGHFYNGDIRAVSYSGGRVALLKQWSLEPSLSLNQVSLPVGAFTSTVLRARTDYGFSPRMFASALVQYSSTDHVYSSNLRFRWEYRPGSEFFVVYADEHDTVQRGFVGLRNRAFVVKVNRMMRF